MDSTIESMNGEGRKRNPKISKARKRLRKFLDVGSQQGEKKSIIIGTPEGGSLHSPSLWKRAKGDQVSEERGLPGKLYLSGGARGQVKKRSLRARDPLSEEKVSKESLGSGGNKQGDRFPLRRLRGTVRGAGR